MAETEHIVTFTSDGYRLVGTLHVPETLRPPLVIGCHGLLSDRSSPKQIRLARACLSEGMAYFRFDHRGCGESQGDVSRVTSLTARCRDLEEAVAVLERYPGMGPLSGLFGSSFGGTVVLAYAAGRRIPAVVTYAAPLNSRDIRSADRKDPVPALSKIPPNLVQSLDFDVEPRLEGVQNLLVVHGQDDEVVPVDHARRIHRRADAPKRLNILAGGDHRMSDPDHQQLFLKEFVDWVIQRKRG
jgi:alpha-beta hydrolase superfamily lysophospholipase